jgi:peptidoglycan glycosyltransferase
VRIAGKTGTADDRAGRVVCWFVGYAPAVRPRLAVAVAIEAPSGATGGETAAPIAARVLDEAAAQGLLR